MCWSVFRGVECAMMLTDGIGLWPMTWTISIPVPNGTRESGHQDQITRFHAGAGERKSRRHSTIEKIRFIKPDVAVVQVAR
jgi:hypothetical protein